MRVAVNLEQLLFRAPGGTGRYTARIVSLLTRLFPGDSVIPFTARHRSRDLLEAYRDFGLDQAQVPGPVVLALPRPLLYDAWNRLAIPRLDVLKSFADCDLVHAPSPAVPPTGRLPLVVTVHDAAFELFPEAYPRRGRRFHQLGVEAAARRADLVITVSESAAEEITTHTSISRQRLRVVPNGVDHVEATPGEIAEALDNYKLGGTPYVLWVGTQEPRKNLKMLVSAYARLVEGGGITHRLVLAGPIGWLADNLISGADRARLKDRIRIVGRVSESELRALYAGADVFAFPSRHEGFGLPVLEAMVQGACVICSDIDALREVAAGAARFVPPSDVDAWVDNLGELLSQPSSRAALGVAGRIRAGDFSWEATVTATRAVYAEAVGG